MKKDHKFTTKIGNRDITIRVIEPIYDGTPKDVLVHVPPMCSNIFPYEVSKLIFVLTKAYQKAAQLQYDYDRRLYLEI